MKVLHVDSGKEWRGGQTQLLHLVRGASGEHHVALPVGAPLVSTLQGDGIATHTLSGRGGFGGLGDL